MVKVHAVCISTETGTRKDTVESITLVEEHGVRGDAHAGSGRQVSLLDVASIDRLKPRLATLGPGDFAENITLEGFDPSQAQIGMRLEINDVVLEITQIGKKCHHMCDIRKQVGACAMPKEGLFARVIRGGEIAPGDAVTF
jgi:MOSC domain-containing protein YiiM